MRLIDADKIVNFRVTAGDGKKYVLLPVEKLDDIPTAYDVDKVVEELEFNSYSKHIPTYDNPYTGGSVIDEDDAIEIVKRGGVDDK